MALLHLPPLKNRWSIIVDPVLLTVLSTLYPVFVISQAYLAFTQVTHSHCGGVQEGKEQSPNVS